MILRTVAKGVRWILGRVILALDWMFSPKVVTRQPAGQAAIDSQTRGWALYQFHACPFCVKVRRTICELGLKIELRDATAGKHRDELLSQGGELQVPCLRIPKELNSANTQDVWMYESAQISQYLRNRFAIPQAPAEIGAFSYRK